MLKRWPVQSLAFFALFCLYLWLEVDLRLVYHGGPMIVGFPPFFKSWEFFGRYLPRPGGILEYGSAFLSQLFCFSWAGALVVTLQAWLVSLCTAAYLKALDAFSLRGSRFIGPLLMLVVYAEYSYHFNVTMMALGAMALACAYVKLRPDAGKASLPFFLALHGIAYVALAGGHLLFVALCAVYETLSRRRWRLALSFLASGAVVPCVVGCWGFRVAPLEAFGYSLFAPLEAHVYGQFAATVVKLSLLYLFLPLAAVVLWLRRGKTDGGSDDPAVSARRLAGAALPFMAGAVVILVFRNAEARAELALGYCAYHRQWPEALEVAGDLEGDGKYPHPCILHTVNRALYHTGRLGRDMFRYPQHPALLLLTDGNIPGIYVSWYRFDTLLDLGQVNYAEYHLDHCAEYFGPRPVILRRLAFIHMAKGNIPTARVYLNALARTLFDAGWARGYLELLKSDPALSTDREIQRLRGMMLEKDRPVLPAAYDDGTGFNAMERMLLDLLERNPGNRMACEYLMALYMLNKRLDRVGGHLDRLRQAGFARMPRLYEEALVARAWVHKDRDEPGPVEVSEEVRAGAGMFMGALNAFRQSRDPGSMEGFRGGYLYYYFCVE